MKEKELEAKRRNARKVFVSSEKKRLVTVYEFMPL